MKKNGFIEGMTNESKVTYTENGAKAVNTTNSALVDLFGTIGAIRGREKENVEHLFEKAYVEDSLLATRLAFYARNIRGGLGERKVPRVLFKYLANTRPEIISKNMEHIPHYGRWDDLYVFEGTKLESQMWDLLKAQFETDMVAMQEGKPVTMLGKWLKSVNASSKETNRLGVVTAKKFGLTPKAYRKSLVALRRYIDVVEVKMSAGEWDKIQYAGVTSQAMTRYRLAFGLRDPEGFEAYIESLEQGETKVNASTLYPYNIIEAYGLNGWSNFGFCKDKPDAILEEQWKALPNYVEGENNVIVMADTSGSMSGRPMDTAVGLAMYFAERNKGAYKDMFMTFSSKPSFVTLKGDTLYARVRNIPAIVDNTDLQKAFELILDVAVKNSVPADEMPKSMIVVSDMEFDYMVDGAGSYNTYYEGIESMYREAGYTVPTIVFWNVDSRQDVFHASSDKKGVQMVSGQSVSTFQTVLRNIGKTPYEAVIETLNSEEYARITI